MGVDEALGERVALTGRPAVRFYQWTPATLSLGYFQFYAARGEHRVSANLPVVRRASGGGAIVHDRELTYSCAFPVRDRLGRPAQQLVDEFHLALMEALQEWRIAACQCESASGTSREEEPFLCFLRRAAGDVLLDGAKIAGSASGGNVARSCSTAVCCWPVHRGHPSCPESSSWPLSRSIPRNWPGSGLTACSHGWGCVSPLAASMIRCVNEPPGGKRSALPRRAGRRSGEHRICRTLHAPRDGRAT